MKSTKVIIISGPTASCKTSTSIELVKYFESNHKMEILNFDSLYFYKELNIGSAKPTMAERLGVKHHLIDINSISNAMNAHDYIKLASPLLDKLLQAGITPILVGGSGFYLRALINGMYQDEGEKELKSEQVEKIISEEGMDGVRKRLRQVDAESFNSLHPNDHYRNIRALQYFLNNNRPFSYLKSEKSAPYHLDREGLDLFHIYLDFPKLEHEKIINTRTQQMLDHGLISEIESLLKMGFTGDEKPLLSVGNKEVLEYLKGLIKTKEELTLKISISTRQLAKAQRTFFKKITPKNTYHPLNDKVKIFKEVEQFLNNKEL